MAFIYLVVTVAPSWEVQITLRPFLQQCALRSQDFAIFHTEYIEFENPDRCGSAFSTD